MRKKGARSTSPLPGGAWPRSFSSPVLRAPRVALLLLVTSSVCFHWGTQWERGTSSPHPSLSTVPRLNVAVAAAARAGAIDAGWPIGGISVADDLSARPRPVPIPNVPGEAVFPRRLFTVVGLENSGTKMLTEALAVAVGARNSSDPFAERYRGGGGDAEVIHMSQPWGYDGSCGGLDGVPDMFALVPEGCSRGGVCSPGFRAPSRLPDSCLRAGLKDFVTYPPKFFLDIASHILWYEERGVKTATAICVRDSTVSLLGKMRERCENAIEARREQEHGRQLIERVLRGPFLTMNASRTAGGMAGGAKIILVSYEILMAYKEAYLLRIYNELGINSTYVPPFEDGNPRYMRMKRSKL